MYIVNIKGVKGLKTPHGKTVRWLLPKEIGAPNFEMRYFEVTRENQPSEDEHPWEHEVFVVQGEGILKSGRGERTVKTGDAIFIPPNEPHQFSNVKEEPFGFICVIPKGCEDTIKDRR